MLKGKFISFEGIDGSGKTTQIKLLNDKLLLSGQKTVIYREPGGTKISEKIRNILLDKNNLDLCDNSESLLFFASRHQLLLKEIIPSLDKGFFVLCDRFNDSTIAYQGYGKDGNIASLRNISDFVIKKRQPDMTFYLDIDVKLSIKRRKLLINDRIEEKGIRYLKKVRKGFLTLAKEHPRRIYVLEGSSNKEKIFEEIWNIINEKYKIN